MGPISQLSAPCLWVSWPSYLGSHREPWASSAYYMQTVRQGNNPCPWRVHGGAILKGSSWADVDRKMPVSLKGGVGHYLGKGWYLDSTKSKHIPLQCTPCWARSMTFLCGSFRDSVGLKKCLIPSTEDMKAWVRGFTAKVGHSHYSTYLTNDLNSMACCIRKSVTCAMPSWILAPSPSALRQDLPPGSAVIGRIQFFMSCRILLGASSFPAVGTPTTQQLVSSYPESLCPVCGRDASLNLQYFMGKNLLAITYFFQSNIKQRLQTLGDGNYLKILTIPSNAQGPVGQVLNSCQENYQGLHIEQDLVLPLSTSQAQTETCTMQI